MMVDRYYQVAVDKDFHLILLNSERSERVSLREIWMNLSSMTARSMPIV